MSTIVYRRQLLTLLFARARLGLRTQEQPPVLDGDLGYAVAQPAPSSDMASRWNALWSSSWSEISRSISDPLPQDPRYSPTDDLRWDVESWGLDENSLDRWIGTLRQVSDREYLDSVEYRARHALEIAWKRGLTTIVVLPYKGHHHRQRDRTVLEISAETYLDESSFREALMG